MKSFQPVVVLVVMLMLTACSKSEGPSSPGAKTPAAPIAKSPAGPLKEFSQQIEASQQPQKMKVGETIILTVKVTNVGKEEWPRKGVHLVYFWQDARGNSKQGVYGKTGYPEKAILSGESMSTDLSVTAPDKSGKYTLILTMVQEDVAFFNRKGAKSLDIPVTVK